MHKVTIALAAFVVFLGCDVGSPTSPSAAKRTEAAVEQCPTPILGIAGTWVGQGSFRVDCPACDRWSKERISTVDTLRIELALDPNPTGEPGVTYYDYTLLSYYAPSEWDDPGLADLGLPGLYRERRGKMGVYYADGGTWAFNYTETYIREWDTETKEYYEPWWPRSPFWGFELKMFDGWLALRWSEDSYQDYERVDESTPVEPEFEPGYVDAWVGEYEGSGDFALSNGVSGQDRPVSISIVRVSPKQVTVSATLVYGEGRNDFIQALAILQPDDPEQITLEVRYLNSKTVYALTKEEDTITGSIATSSLRLGGTWGQGQTITAIEVVRQ